MWVLKHKLESYITPRLRTVLEGLIIMCVCFGLGLVGYCVCYVLLYVLTSIVSRLGLGLGWLY